MYHPDIDRRIKVCRLTSIFLALRRMAFIDIFVYVDFLHAFGLSIHICLTCIENRQLANTYEIAVTNMELLLVSFLRSDFIPKILRFLLPS